ncbi:dnaJ homolog subfamily C member 9 isoform X2 [Ostrinia furnacalis]|uniref:dnaJ homolog subfamily C member 9 isoform X2 n=1 Tax=Ostrinia furnacalis TaxID=93504 RepID=UPI001039F5BD|nr:dnaJ homolog subfamily C member 9 isoform X2 [Ostrinia furnacalis]
MGLIELCEKYFKTSNLYEVLGITEKATDKEVKKAYHKLSLKVHPDRVDENEKLEATEKFKVLGSIHTILSDPNKRALYDETKSVDDDDYNVIVDRDWTIYWRMLFKKITDEDIKAYEKEYVGSEQEKNDLKVAYLSGKGDMDYICDQVQFARSDQESRIRGILSGMIENGEIPPYKIFTNEPARKRKRRWAKENREAKEAEELKNELGLGSENNSLELMIKQKQQSRAQQMDSFIDDLAAKYGGDKKATKRKAAPKTETKSKRKK